MECKGRHTPTNDFRYDSIDLTRMECKAFIRLNSTARDVRIDLTRMECKVATFSTISEPHMYRFNQNGM